MTRIPLIYFLQIIGSSANIRRQAAFSPQLMADFMTKIRRYLFWKFNGLFLPKGDFIIFR
jgi:hypothetical protein